MSGSDQHVGARSRARRRAVELLFEADQRRVSMRKLVGQRLGGPAPVVPSDQETRAVLDSMSSEFSPQGWDGADDDDWDDPVRDLPAGMWPPREAEGPGEAQAGGAASASDAAGDGFDPAGAPASDSATAAGAEGGTPERPWVTPSGEPMGRVRLYAAQIVNGVAEHQGEIDETIDTYSLGWPVERMPAVDRAIARMGCWEILFGGVPGPVVLKEAADLAGDLSTAKSPNFLSGLLGRIAQYCAPGAAA
ncbi:MAG: hypothetical protein LBM66_05500 [Bifidobacteriaceae bacterium]|nr:hypothetical protein [Bifidobacteriaceae bacterium]